MAQVKELLFLSSFLFGSIFLIYEAQSLPVMEIMAPYLIRNMGNGLVMTASEQGIVGLKTGAVTATPFQNLTSQHWMVIWDPTFDNKNDGYRIESKQEYLNSVSTFYTLEDTRAIDNFYRIIELPAGIRVFMNKRTRKCLQITPLANKVVQRTCSPDKNRFQQWRIEKLDFDKRM